MLKALTWNDIKADPEYKQLAKDILYRIREISPAILAGGTFRRLVEGQLYKGADFDFYFRNKQDLHLVEKILSYKNLIVNTSNALTYLIKNFNGYTVSIQLIKSIYPSHPKQLFNNFDFRCCMFSTDYDDPNIVLYQSEALQDIEDKILTIYNTQNGYNTIKRVIKYAGDGYNVNKKQLMELLGNIKSGKTTLFGNVPSEGDSSVSDLLTIDKKDAF